jgi:hypothetical protein
VNQRVRAESDLFGMAAVFGAGRGGSGVGVVS